MLEKKQRPFWRTLKARFVSVFVSLPMRTWKKECLHLSYCPVKLECLWIIWILLISIAEMFDSTRHVTGVPWNWTDLHWLQCCLFVCFCLFMQAFEVLDIDKGLTPKYLYHFDISMMQCFAFNNNWSAYVPFWAHLITNCKITPVITIIIEAIKVKACGLNHLCRSVLFSDNLRRDHFKKTPFYNFWEKLI